MKVQVLILVLLVPSWLDAEQQYYGTRIASLTLSGAESQADLPVLPIRSGEIITAENIRLSIQALYNTGHYSYVEVDATPAANGETNLEFRVHSNFFFSTIRLEPENILERPLSGYFRLPYGEKYTTSTVDALVRDTAEMLKAEGYFEATITSKNQLDEAMHLAFVTLSVVRCMASITNRGARGDDHRVTSTAPRTTEAVSNTRESAPVARVPPPVERRKVLRISVPSSRILAF